jgi:hypothetical protein
LYGGLYSKAVVDVKTRSSNSDLAIGRETFGMTGIKVTITLTTLYLVNFFLKLKV